MYIDKKSEVSGAIIAFLLRARFLPFKEKQAVIKAIPNKKIVARLLELAFNGNILRMELSSICKKIHVRLVNANWRLAEFIRIHEKLVAGEISLKDARESIIDMMSSLHKREFSFYEDLLQGGTCYIDYVTYKKFLAESRNDNLIRFMRPKTASPETIWSGNRLIVQPNYQGLQLKVILTEGKPPRLIANDQENYYSRMKKTLKLAQSFLPKIGESRIEFDAILLKKDKTRPYMDWKANDCYLFIYDCPKKGVPLNKRLQVVREFVTFMRRHENKRIMIMPTEVVTGPLVAKIAKSYCRASNPDGSRNGIIVKRWDSPYTLKRSADWLCFFPYKEEESDLMLDRSTIVGVNEQKTMLYTLDNNNIEVPVYGSPQTLQYVSKYIGYTVEYKPGLEPRVRRILFIKGREI